MKFKIEQLDEKTVDNFWRLRKELFLELGEVSNEMDISELKSATEQYYLSHINKDLLCWGLYQEGKIVAIGSLCLFSRIPYQENLSGTEGYILNIYTSKHFRKCGFALIKNGRSGSEYTDLSEIWPVLQSVCDRRNADSNKCRPVKNHKMNSD